jgi:hypothetical protein
MDQRDQELLDKQLWGVNPEPPRSGSLISLAFIAAFIVGMAIGSLLFSHDTKSTQIASHDATNAFARLD